MVPLLPVAVQTMTPSRNRIRIESDENVVMNAKIYYLPEDEGEPIDISRCVTGVDLHLHVGEVARATLHTILVDGYAEADLEQLVIKRLKRRLRFRRVHRLWDAITDRAKTRIARSLSPQLQREYAKRAKRR